MTVAIIWRSNVYSLLPMCLVYISQNKALGIRKFTQFFDILLYM